VASAESLLSELSGADPQITELIAGTGPLLVPFDTLTQTDGWLVDLSSDHPAPPFDDPSLPGEQRIVHALLVACDYAIRRGAETTDDAQTILRRESPVALLVETEIGSRLRRLVDDLGIGGRAPESFARRRRGHELAGSVISDPALSFKQRSVDQDIGDNALSSLLVHAEGEEDQAVASGEIGERWAVDIGLPADATLELIHAVEREAAVIPSFLRGITSYASSDGIVVGWPHGHAPEPQEIAVVIQAWTKALFDLPTASVQVIFGPPTGESEHLTELRERADTIRMYRDAMRSDADPSSESTKGNPGG
jgi:hypothetical protein